MKDGAHDAGPLEKLGINASNNAWTYDWSEESQEKELITSQSFILFLHRYFQANKTKSIKDKKAKDVGKVEIQPIRAWQGKDQTQNHQPRQSSEDHVGKDFTILERGGSHRALLIIEFSFDRHCGEDFGASFGNGGETKADFT